MPEPAASQSIELDSNSDTVLMWTSTGASKWLSSNQIQNIQWAKKLIFKRANFACESICGPEDKGKPWEFVVTRLNIISFVVPNSKYLALFVDLILDLEYTPLDQSVFLLTLKSGPVMSYHMAKPYILSNLPSRVYIPPLGIICPPVNMSSNTQQHIVTLLQNGKSCQQMAAQMHVSYSTVQRLYSSVKDSLPKHPGGHPRQLIANDPHPLARKSPLEQLVLPHC